MTSTHCYALYGSEGVLLSCQDLQVARADSLGLPGLGNKPCLLDYLVKEKLHRLPCSDNSPAWRRPSGLRMWQTLIKLSDYLCCGWVTCLRDKGKKHNKNPPTY